MSADVSVISVDTHVNENTNKDEDDDGRNLQEGQPVLYNRLCMRNYRRSSGSRLHTEFTVGTDVRGVHTNEEHPEQQTDNPRIPVGPELEHELRSSEV